MSEESFTLIGGVPYYSDGVGTLATFNTPMGIGMDPNGNIFVADMYNHCIRKITNVQWYPTVSTFAGNQKSTAYRDGVGTSASFNLPTGIAVDTMGNVYVSSRNNRVRKISPQGSVTTIAGHSSYCPVNHIINSCMCYDRCGNFCII
jgi:sugar lactone lactonase YvrE